MPRVSRHQVRNRRLPAEHKVTLAASWQGHQVQRRSEQQVAVAVALRAQEDGAARAAGNPIYSYDLLYIHTSAARSRGVH